jgi:adenine phosphoribosyltransferase
MMPAIDLKGLIREMVDKNRCDLTLLLRDSKALDRVVLGLAEPFRNDDLDRVVGIEAMGFALRGAVARELNVGLVLLRKSDKVAWSTTTTRFMDYSGEEKALEFPDDAITPGDRVAIVDDWVETGEQLSAAIQLVEKCQGIVIGASLLNIDSGVRSDARFSGYRLCALLDY